MFGGCATAPPAEIGALPLIEPVTPGAKIEDPFLVKEASQPVGFPPAGPVGEIVIKRYPAARMAVTHDAASKSPQNSMFMSLFRHIKKNDVAMTSPVVMTYSAASATASAAKLTRPESMAFVYGDPAIGKVGVDGTVEVLDVPPVTVLSIGVRGGYRERNFESDLKRLLEYIAAHADRFKPAGPPRFLGYNSPFVPWFMSFGEIQVPVIESK